MVASVGLRLVGLRLDEEEEGEEEGDDLDLGAGKHWALRPQKPIRVIRDWGS